MSISCQLNPRYLEHQVPALFQAQSHLKILGTVPKSAVAQD